jgi:FkbM family methyltransferase
VADEGTRSINLELERLLSEEPAQVLARERALADEFASSGTPLVLFGAGNLGRKTLRGLRGLGLNCVAFSDNAEALWGREVEGLPVLCPSEAAARFGSRAAFVVTIWRGESADPMRALVQQLQGLGCERVVTFVPLYWRDPAAFLPHYTIDSPHKVIAQAAAIRGAFALWADAASSREYVAQLRFRLRADFDALPSPVSHDIYFPDDLVAFSSDEVFADCGAYDGDTIRTLVKRRGSAFGRIIAFEPDPRNFARLQQYATGLGPETARKIVVHPFAVGARHEMVPFSATGSASSSVGGGTLLVESVAMEALLADQPPTYIKMDVEGAELDALAGARHLIEHHTPVLAIAAYHRQDHLWRVPRYIRELSDDYHLFLRPHVPNGWDLVCYAVPTRRLLEARCGSGERPGTVAAGG